MVTSSKWWFLWDYIFFFYGLGCVKKIYMVKLHSSVGKWWEFKMINQRIVLCISVVDFPASTCEFVQKVGSPDPPAEKKTWFSRRTWLPLERDDYLSMCVQWFCKSRRISQSALVGIWLPHGYPQQEPRFSTCVTTVCSTKTLTILNLKVLVIGDSSNESSQVWRPVPVMMWRSSTAIWAAASMLSLLPGDPRDP